MTTDKLNCIGVALLRHDGAAGRPLVGQSDKAKGLGRPDDDFFRHARQVQRALAGGHQIINRKVPVGHAIQAVVGWLVKAKRLGRRMTIYWKACARKCCGTKRTFIHPRARIDKAAAIPADHFKPGH